MTGSKESKIVQGLILRVYVSGDADLVLHLLTPSEGKLSIIAKHGRRGGKRFNGTPDLFDCGRFEIRQGRGSLPTLHGFTPTVHLSKLRETLDRISAGAVLCEIVDYLTVENAHSDDACQYDTVLTGLESVQHATTRAELLAAVFTCAAELMEQAGFLDREQLGTGSVKRLQRLLSHIETCVEKKLTSRPAFEQVLDDFRDEATREV